MKATLCDICRDEAATLFITTGRGLDAAGDMDTDGESVDLCNKHALEALGRALAKNYALGKEVLSWVRQQMQSEKNERNRRTNR